MNQTLKKDGKVILGPQFFFVSFTSTSGVAKLSSCAIKGKIKNQTWENGKKKKTNFGPDFAPNLVPKTFSEVLPLLDVKRYKLWSYLISRDNNESNLKKWQKKLVLGLILVPLAQIWAPKFFLWTLPQLDVRHYCKLSL